MKLKTLKSTHWVYLLVTYSCCCWLYLLVLTTFIFLLIQQWYSYVLIYSTHREGFLFHSFITQVSHLYLFANLFVHHTLICWPVWACIACDPRNNFGLWITWYGIYMKLYLTYGIRRNVWIYWMFLWQFVFLWYFS